MKQWGFTSEQLNVSSHRPWHKIAESNSHISAERSLHLPDTSAARNLPTKEKTMEICLP